MLEVDIVEDAPTFDALVRGLLEKHEPENNLFLGSLDALRKDPPASPPLMVRASDHGRTVFAAIRREPHLLVTRGTEEAIAATAAKLAEHGAQIGAVTGPMPAAGTFATAWAQLHRRRAIVTEDERLYQLTEVSWPAPVPGAMRLIGLGDLELATTWALAFDAEAHLVMPVRTFDQVSQLLTRRIGAGNLFGWELDNQLVAMAGLVRSTTRTIAINSVYTPPNQRGRGFASSLVAGVTQVGLQRGKDCVVLYTDLSNPTSNSIYQKLGYRPVCEWKNYRIDGPLIGSQQR
ncbi:MAG: putative acetyltransferase [Myxococcales bacterium]|nr:putative acetyltransferase [Myxococcales bacterium]